MCLFSYLFIAFFFFSTVTLAKLIHIMSRYQHRYFWPSLAIPRYCPLLLAGLLGYIQYRHRAALCRFELDVLPLLVSVKGSTGVLHLQARPNFSSSVRMSGSSNFDSFRDGWLVAVQLLFCGVLSPGLVQYCSQHSCVIAVKGFFYLLYHNNHVLPSWLEMKNTQTAYLERGKTPPPTNLLYMILNNLMVRLQ